MNGIFRPSEENVNYNNHKINNHLKKVDYHNPQES